MINAYGLISYQGIEYSANMNISNSQTRYAQDNMMLYQWLYNHVNKTIKKKIITKTEKYIIGGQPIVAVF